MQQPGWQERGEWLHVYVWPSHFPVHLKLPQYCLHATPQYRSLRSENKIRFYSGEKKDGQSFPRVTHNLMILVTYQDGGLVLSLCTIAGFQGALFQVVILRDTGSSLWDVTSSHSWGRTQENLTPAGHWFNPEATCVPSVHSLLPCVSYKCPEEDQTCCRAFWCNGVLR
jgi:hypothetical protein